MTKTKHCRRGTRSGDYGMFQSHVSILQVEVVLCRIDLDTFLIRNYAGAPEAGAREHSSQQQKATFLAKSKEYAVRT